MPLTYIDIFAGAGGLTAGFRSNGYEAIAHVEMMPGACLTLKTRECYYYLKRHNRLGEYNKYLKHEISREELYSLVPQSLLDSVLNVTMSKESMQDLFALIDSLKESKNIDEVDVLVGGPPCQAYSLVGRARSKNNMENDPRNYLYMLYKEVLKKYHPRIFVFENVPGLLTAKGGAYLKDMKSQFRDAGYKLECNILNSKEYGVLQNRRRVILIGWQTESGFSYPQLRKVKEEYLVKDLLSDLPPIAPGESSNHYDSPPTEYLKKSGIRKKEDVLTWHEARPHIERDREIYKHVISTWNNSKQRLRYSDLPEELCTHKNRSSFLDRFKVVASDLPTAQTMVAHISKDGHYYIHPDIKQARSLSVREAARIQSFPDNFYFEGGRTSAYLQIGNAVPPLMAEAIASSLKHELMEKKKNER